MASQSVDWNIYSVNYILQSGVITVVNYTVTVFNEGESIQGDYSQRLDPPDFSNFVDYDLVTEKLCLYWLIQKLGTNRIQEIQSDLAQALYNQMHPTKGTGLPWGGE